MGGVGRKEKTGYQGWPLRIKLENSKGALGM